MDAFFDYLRNITYYLLFMTAVGVIAPSGNYKKYITLIMGIMLIGLVVSPITTIIGRQAVPMTEIFAGIVPVPLNQDVLGQTDHIQTAFHHQLTAQTEALLARNNYQLIRAEWDTAENFTYIRHVNLTVRVLDTTPTPRPFIHIEPVRVAPYQPLSQAEEDTPEALAIKKLISDFYDMPLDNIHVIIQKE